MSFKTREKRGNVLKRITLILILFCFIFYPLITTASILSDAQRKVNDLKNQMNQQQKIIDQKENEATTLANEIAILDGQIQVAELALQATKLQISDTNDQIAQEERELEQQQKMLNESLRLMYEEQQTSIIETLFTSRSFSAVLDRIEYLNTVKDKIDTAILRIKQIKSELEIKRASLDILRQQQEVQASSLNSQKTQKANLLAETQGQEALYQQKLAQTKQNFSKAQAEEQAAEAAAGSSYDAPPSPFGFSWPTQDHTITCAWHCYHVGNYWHSGIDLRNGLGAPIFAAADGVVTHDGKQDPSNTNTWPWSLSYGNYVEISHSGNFQSLYAHLYYDNVVRSGQTVHRGQLIGYTGNTGYSSGPHLHFEIRYNEIPVNPAPYLP
jgi:murein DD-endopeptidase MepM/ murein hydrolase activator NlpD